MTRKILILGAGGHGRVIADMVQRQADSKLLGFLDDRHSGEVNGYPCLGPISELERIIANPSNRPLGIIIGIGDNNTRRTLHDRLEPVIVQDELYFATVIDPSAVVSPHAILGEGTVVMPNAVINNGANVGSHAIINTAATVDHDCRVGDFAHLSPGVHLAGNVHVGEGTHIGVGAVAIPGVDIGAWSVIGAGSTVVRDIPDNVVAYGVPARIRSLE